ncbi:hypothetical protein CcCBS67573_g08538 [Chytriomyces confervae]|uniref:VWFA domain-containing protein n=1 Tax=Chytriomyces confervae TaxID=246404 RepID=A0A507EJJ5_9FUNG|nr:hypothetical protein CcCBS67573_g08538 [Chytriomyces confervae]
MSQAPPPAYEGSSSSKTIPANNVNSMDAFRSLVMRHEISSLMALKLRKLEAYDIAVICDDSGSMMTKSTMGLTEANPFAPTTTRWDELKLTVQIVTDIAATLDEDGIDVYFLNRPPLRNVTHSSQLEASFSKRPQGYTPITRVLKQVLREKKSGLAESGKNLFILIATDGVPTTDQGVEDKRGLWSVLAYERGDTPIVFLACTDNDAEIEYLNDWDVKLPNLDVVDDYNTERRQILAIQGNSFPFSRGDWVCKMLLGPIDPEIDALDERRVSVGRSATIGRAETLGRRSSVFQTIKKKFGWF